MWHGPRSRHFRYAWLCALLFLIPLEDMHLHDTQKAYDHALLLLHQGELIKSQQEAGQEYARLQTNDPEWAARFKLLEAHGLAEQGLNHEALAALNGLMPDQLTPDDRIQWYVLQGNLLIVLNRFPDADKMLTDAINLCQADQGPSCAGAFYCRGTYLIARGKLEAARQWLLRSLALYTKNRAAYSELSNLTTLSYLALQQEKYDEAIDWANEAYRKAVTLHSENMVQRSLGDLGWAYYELGDKDRALNLFLEAEATAERLGALRNELRWMATTGYIYEETGDTARALNLHVRSLEIAEKIKSKQDIIECLENLAHLTISMGNTQQAEVYLDRAEKLISPADDRLDALDLQFARGRIAAARRDYAKAESLFRAVDADPVSQTSMRLGAEREMAHLDEAQGRIADAEKMYRTAQATFESARDQLKKEDSKLPYLANATPIYDDYIHLLVSQGKNEEALLAADRSRANTLAQGLGIKDAASRTGLNPTAVARKAGATLLFYWLGEKQSYLWAVTPQKTSLFTLPAKDQIEPLVASYRKALVGSDDPVAADNGAGSEDGRKLYRILVAPVAAQLKPATPVMILTDGVLSLLNFETLLAPGPTPTAPPHYWIEDATLLSAPSLSMMAAAKSERSANRKLLLLGDAVSPSADYPELPRAAEEMRQIEKHFLPANETVFTRSQANPSAYLASNPARYSYIHFVTHGVASQTDPLDSAIILSREDGTENSFKLYAREIMQHPIDARVVTIAACYGSGTRAYAGEGLVGLSWAFLRAGSHNVIGALWEASDESTPRLMDALYQGMEAGESPAVALRSAKLALLHSKGSEHKAFYWAPFQLYTRL